MNKILVAYATFSGTTVEVAKTVGEEIAKVGIIVDVLPLGEVKSLDLYDGVVLGGPMIMGWHRDALRFLRNYHRELARIPLAIFVMAMSLTRKSLTSIDGVPICIDENLPKSPEKEGRLNLRERYAEVGNYAHPILAAVRPSKPVSIGFFGGRLDYGRLAWWAVIFAMFIIRAPAGDKRNWPAIRQWASGIPEAFNARSTSQRKTW